MPGTDAIQPDVQRKGWIAAGFVAVPLLLFLSTLISYYNLEELASSQILEEQSLSTRRSLMRLLVLLVDTETGQRGYIITGDETFLNPTENAFAEIPVEMERLRKLLPNENRSNEQFIELQKRVQAKVAQVKLNIKARQEGGFKSAEQQVASQSGKVAMDAIREQIGAMDEQDVDRLREQSRETDLAAHRAQVIIVAANLLACLTAMFSAEQVRRGFRENARSKDAVDRANAELEDNVARRTSELQDTLAELKRGNRERRKLEAEVLRVSEREQARIAEDLHDGQGQLLAGALHLVTAHTHRLSAAGSSEAKEAENLRQLVREALEQTRLVARGLYPVKDTPKGLAVALQDLVAGARRIFDINCELECSAPVLVQDHTLATNLFRIAQEAVNNSAKHGESRSIKIRLSAVANQIELTVEDDGRGLPADFENRSGLGIRMMRHRAEIIGATLTITTIPKGGVRTVCSAPRNVSPQPTTV